MGVHLVSTDSYSFVDTFKSEAINVVMVPSYTSIPRDIVYTSVL